MLDAPGERAERGDAPHAARFPGPVWSLRWNVEGRPPSCQGRIVTAAGMPSIEARKKTPDAWRAGGSLRAPASGVSVAKLRELIDSNAHRSRLPAHAVDRGVVGRRQAERGDQNRVLRARRTDRHDRVEEAGTVPRIGAVAAVAAAHARDGVAAAVGDAADVTVAVGVDRTVAERIAETRPGRSLYRRRSAYTRRPRSRSARARCRSRSPCRSPCLRLRTRCRPHREATRRPSRRRKRNRGSPVANRKRSRTAAT